MSSIQSSSSDEEMYYSDEDTSPRKIAPVVMLDDYSLQIIFSYIPLWEQVQLERVCVQWKRAVKDLLKKVQYLDLPNGVPAEFPKQYLTLPLLKKIFKRAPLIHLHIQGTTIQHRSGIIEAIVHYCPQLEELHLFDLRLNGAKIHMFAKLKNLKVLALHNCEPIKDNALKFALQNNRVLTRLEITLSSFTNGQFLRFIDAPLETLNLYSHPKLNTLCLEEGLAKFGSTLKHLSLSSLNAYSSEIKRCLKYTPNLQSLTLGKYKLWNWYTEDLHYIKHLKQLESLDFSFCDIIDDEYMQFLVKECQQLRSLNLTGIVCKDPLEYDRMYHISCLNGLQNLRSLNLSFLPDVTPAELRRYVKMYPPIEYLYLVAHPNIKDVDVFVILRSCSQLKHLDLSACGRITKKTIKAANKVLNSRCDYQPLELVVGGTNIKAPKNDNNAAVANHPLLNVSYKNTLPLMHRQFFIGQNNYKFEVEKSDEIDEDSDSSDSSDNSVTADDQLFMLKMIAEATEDSEWSESSWTGTESDVSDG